MIADFGNPVEAHLTKACLEAEETPAFLLDEDAISINPFYSSPLGGVKLAVAEEDVPKPRELLNLE